MTFAATRTAPGLARAFVAHNLANWGVRSLTDTATLIVSELATNAVKATGVMAEGPVPCVALERVALIGVQVWMRAHSLFVEVWDPSQEVPALLPEDDDAEGGRGMWVVRSVSHNWGVWMPPLYGGKVVWAELRVDQPARPVGQPEPLPRRVRQGAATGEGQLQRMAERTLLLRVRDALLVWEPGRVPSRSSRC